MREGLTYDDVLLIPQKSSISSRSDVDVSANIGGIRLEVPVFSASMDSVTGTRMAQAMADSGGAGIIHRFCDPLEQARMVSEVDGIVGAAIGISTQDFSRLTGLEQEGADFICIDVAHGHMEKVIDITEDIAGQTNLPLMVGTVATRDGAKDLAKAGADIIRVGVGPGSSCLTREKAGVGVPQMTAIQEAAKNPYDVPVIADGGIEKPGDIVKALMAGADGVVIGGLFGSCEESLAEPVWKMDGWYKKVRGMASEPAQRDLGKSEIFVEGDTYLTKLDGTVSDKMEGFEKGIRSGISYCGGHDIESARENAEFITVTPNTVRKNGLHDGKDSIFQND